MRKPDYKQKLKHLFESLNGVVISDANLSMNQPIPELFNIDSVQQVCDLLNSGLNVPLKKAGFSTLGGKENVSILLLIAFQPKEQWAHGILENSHYARFHIEKDGTIEMFSGGDIKNRFRKTRVKSVNDILNKLNQWIAVEGQPMQEGIEDLNTTTVNLNKKDGIFDDPYAQEPNISVNPDGAGNPNPSLPENQLKVSTVKKQVKHLQAGDMLSSGTKIVKAPVVGLNTPRGQVEMVVEYPNGLTKPVLWGKDTYLYVRLKPLVPKVKEEQINTGDGDSEPMNNYTPPIGLGSGLGEEEEIGNTDYNEGTPTNPDNDITKPRIG